MGAEIVQRENLQFTKNEDKKVFTVMRVCKTKTDGEAVVEFVVR